MNILLRQSAKNTNLRSNKLPGTRNFFYRRVKEGCECPEPPPDKMVQEKKCGCSFTDWKPTPKKCIEQTIKESMKPKQPKRCFAGMVLRKPPPECCIEEIDPFKKNCCIHKKPTPEKPPKAKKPEEELPYADWDTDCK